MPISLSHICVGETTPPEIDIGLSDSGPLADVAVSTLIDEALAPTLTNGEKKPCASRCTSIHSVVGSPHAWRTIALPDAPRHWVGSTPCGANPNSYTTS